MAQALRDLEIAESVLPRWIRETAAELRHAFPGHGQVKPEQQEIDRLRREVAKLTAERDIQKKAAWHPSSGIRVPEKIALHPDYFAGSGPHLLQVGEVERG